MVAAGDDIDATGEQFFGDPGGDAVAAGGVFAVGDDEIERLLFAKYGQERFDRVTSRLADNIADEKQFHGGKINHVGARVTRLKFEDGEIRASLRRLLRILYSRQDADHGGD